MAAGCPTVYSKCGSGPELMVSGRDGLLVDPHDPAEIADATVRLLKDDELAQTIGANGRQRVLSAFSAETLVPANELFYQRVIQAFGRGRLTAELTCIEERSTQSR
jgi:glycosyltransferase involved in cell wall biosynthesis